MEEIGVHTLLQGPENRLRCLPSIHLQGMGLSWYQIHSSPQPLCAPRLPVTQKAELLWPSAGVPGGLRAEVSMAPVFSVTATTASVRAPTISTVTHLQTL